MKLWEQRFTESYKNIIFSTIKILKYQWLKSFLGYLYLDNRFLKLQITFVSLIWLEFLPFGKNITVSRAG